MKEKVLYVVQSKTGGRWKKTFWTRRGRPVSKPAAEKAMERAKTAFPKDEFRIAKHKEVKP